MRKHCVVTCCLNFWKSGGLYKIYRWACRRPLQLLLPPDAAIQQKVGGVGKFRDNVSLNDAQNDVGTRQ
jgi:hypothetical protein